MVVAVRDAELGVAQVPAVEWFGWVLYVPVKLWSTLLITDVNKNELSYTFTCALMATACFTRSVVIFMLFYCICITRVSRFNHLHGSLSSACFPSSFFLSSFSFSVLSVRSKRLLHVL